MTEIQLTTFIKASINTCFDLSRNIDIHLMSASKTKEKVIRGKANGLCELGDEITWEAIHFGIRQQLTVKITQFNPPYFFEDSMLKGAFRRMNHLHYFYSENGGTIMKDIFRYEVPGGLLGYFFDQLILKSHMHQFLLERNQYIKTAAEQYK